MPWSSFSFHPGGKRREKPGTPSQAGTSRNLQSGDGSASIADRAPPCDSGPALSVPSGVGDGVAVEQAASAKAATPMAIGTNQGTMLPLFERVSLIFIWVRRFGVRTSSRVSQYIFRWEGQLANKGQDQRPDHQGTGPGRFMVRQHEASEERIQGRHPTSVGEDEDCQQPWRCHAPTPECQ